MARKLRQGIHGTDAPLKLRGAAEVGGDPDSQTHLPPARGEVVPDDVIKGWRSQNHYAIGEGREITGGSAAVRRTN